jgi:branched-chain amino acid transport system permease protein
MGSMYALIAIGYTLVYGVLRFINFAHCDVFMVGAFVGFYMGKNFSSITYGGGVLVMIVAMLACAALGILIELLAYRPLRNRSRLTVLITAIGVSLFLENAGQLDVVFGVSPRPFPQIFPKHEFALGQLVVSSKDLVVFAVTISFLLALKFIVQRTKIGTAMRAVSFNPQAASLMGVNVNVVISFTFGLGSALAAAGGILWAHKFPKIDPLMGVAPGVTAFVAAVLGGIGNIPGAALGGLLIGIVETFVKGSRFSTWTDAIVFLILILVLLFKPAGLLGKLQPEKV